MTAVATPAPARPAGWWGMALLVTTEATLFVLLVASYFYLRHRAAIWPPAPLHDPKLGKPLVATLILVAGSAPMVVAARSQRPKVVRVALVYALLLALAFLALQWVLVADSLKVFRPQDGAYGSIFYTLIGVHYAHAAAGALAVAWALLRSRRAHPLQLRVTALYVHFVNVAAIAVFLTLYLGPRI